MKHAKQKKGCRIPMINARYLFWTLVILVGEIVLMCAAYAINMLDNFVGYVVLPFWGFFRYIPPMRLPCLHWRRCASQTRAW